jgi:ABC-type transporter MlaC component
LQAKDFTIQSRTKLLQDRKEQEAKLQQQRGKTSQTNLKDLNDERITTQTSIKQTKGSIFKIYQMDFNYRFRFKCARNVFLIGNYIQKSSPLQLERFLFLFPFIIGGYYIYKMV